MKFLLLCIWCACIFFAFLGYGKLLLRIFRAHDAPWALSAAIGVSFVVAVCGFLNLLHLITAPVFATGVLVGVVLGFLVDWPHLRGVPPVLFHTSLLYSPLLIAIAIPVIGNVRSDIRTFSDMDDLPAYLTLPEATLQLKSLPFDPFNERRVTSSLGAPYVLQSLMLVAGDVLSIRAIDISIGFIIYAGLLVAIFRLMGLPVPLRVGLALLALLVPVDRLNATMGVLPAALFCALFLVQIHPSLGGRLDWLRAVLLGLIAAALTSLKSNYLPAAVLVCCFYYVAWLVYRHHLRALWQGLLCVGVFLACLLPWMIDMKQKEGTALFPLLGRGYDASAYGLVPLPSGSHQGLSSEAPWVWLSVLPLAAPLLTALIALAIAFRKQVESAWTAPLSALLASSVLAIAAIGSSTGGESIVRYALPFEIPALIIFIGFLFACSNSLHCRPWWLKASGALAFLGLVAFGYVSGVRHGGYRKYLEDGRFVVPTRGVWVDVDHERQRIRNLQARIPSGERVLARLLLTFPFDFKRNQIFVADYSGMASLPPGMPIDGGPEAMRNYLLSHDIRYLAFDPNRTTVFDPNHETSVQEFLHAGRDRSRHGWLYVQIKVSDTVQQTFADLARMCTHVYDDGEVYVLDLKGTEKAFG